MMTALAGVLLFAAAKSQIPGGGWELQRTLHGRGGGELFGFAVDVGPDYDQDGWPEILVGEPDRRPPSGSGWPGGASLLNGRTGAVIWNFDSPYPYFPAGSAGLVGYAVSFVPDLNQDGFADILIGDRGDSPFLNDPGTGRVYVLDGLRGSIIREHTGQIVGRGGGDWTGETVLGIADVDGDGAGDYVVGSPFSDLGQATYYRRGLVTCYSGRAGTPLWTLGGQFNVQDLGEMLALGPDLNSDGHREILCGTTTYTMSSIWLVNPISGMVIQTLPELLHSSGLRSPCFAVTCIDLNGDGVEDVVGSAALGANYQGAGMVTAWDAITKQVLWSYESVIDWEDFGHSLAPLDDLDLDGVPEILAGVPTKSGHSTNKGYAAVLSGRDGSLLHRFTTRIGDNPWYAEEYGLLVRSFGRDGRRNFALVRQSTYNDEEGVHVVEFQPYLEASRTSVSAASGASIVYELDFPASAAGADYALLASASGRGPATIGGLPVPLTADGVLARTLAGQYPAGFHRPRGSLDAQGRALASLIVAPAGLAAHIGRTFHLAAVAGTGGVPSRSSIAVPLTIQP